MNESDKIKQKKLGRGGDESEGNSINNVRNIAWPGRIKAL